jgi:hypothetical protein
MFGSVPFTPSHVAAVLPLRRAWGGALPLAALAAGSMSPDLPYFVPGLRVLYGWTHTPVGVITVDVVLGLAMWALWRSIAPALHDLSPAPVRERWTLPAHTRPAWWTVPLAVAIGAATHVVWDEFTHAGRFGATHLPFLAVGYPGPFGPLAGYQYAQYGSGVIGLAVVAWVAARQPLRSVPPRARTGLAPALPWLSAAAFVCGAAVSVSLAGGVGIALNALAFAVATGGIGAAAAMVVVVCWAHALRVRATAAAR